MCVPEWKEKQGEILSRRHGMCENVSSLDNREEVDLRWTCQGSQELNHAEPCYEFHASILRAIGSHGKPGSE